MSGRVPDRNLIDLLNHFLFAVLFAERFCCTDFIRHACAERHPVQMLRPRSSDPVEPEIVPRDDEAQVRALGIASKERVVRMLRRRTKGVKREPGTDNQVEDGS